MDRMKMYMEQLKLGEGTEELGEAVVQVGFKDDSAGAAAVGSETSRTGLLVGGKKVKDGTYRLTFKNDRMKDKFMKKYNSKIVDAVELNGSTVKLDSRGLGVTRQSGLGNKKEDVEHVNEEYEGERTLERDSELNSLYRELQAKSDSFLNDILGDLRTLYTEMEAEIDEIYEDVNKQFDRKIDRFGASLVADQLAGGLGARDVDSVFDSFDDFMTIFEDRMQERVREIFRNPPRSNREVLKALENIPVRYVAIAQEAAEEGL